LKVRFSRRGEIRGGLQQLESYSDPNPFAGMSKQGGIEKSLLKWRRPSADVLTER